MVSYKKFHNFRIVVLTSSKPGSKPASKPPSAPPCPPPPPPPPAC